MAEVFFFLAAIGAIAGRSARWRCATRSTRCWRWSCHLHLPGGALPAAAGGVRRRRAGDRLRRRGDGALRLRGRLRRRPGAGAGRRQRAAGCSSSPAFFALRAVRRAGDRADRHRPGRARRRRRAVLHAGSASRPRSGACSSPPTCVAFEVASLLLLIAAVGAVILARRRAGLARPARDLGDRPVRGGDLTAGDAPGETMLEAGGPAQR